MIYAHSTALIIILFAFTTILGWNYYGERCTEYLFGVRGILPYRLVFIGLVAAGAFVHLELIWVLADIVNGLMAIPNLIGLLGLSGVIIAETRAFFEADAPSVDAPCGSDADNASGACPRA